MNFDDSIIKLIQRQINLGDKVTFFLINNTQVNGVLVELGINHVVVKSMKTSQTIITNMIGSWTITEDDQDDELEKKLENKIGLQTDQSSDNSDGQVSKTIIEVINEKSSPIQTIINTKNNGDNSGNPGIDGHEKDDNSEQISDKETEKESGSGKPNKEEPPKEFTSEIIQKYADIISKFNSFIPLAKLDLIAPVFKIDDTEKNLLKTPSVSTLWDQVCQKYDFAKKVNELESKYNRIPRVIQILEDLVSSVPESITFNRHLGYLYRLSEKLDLAIPCYQNAAMVSKQPADWINLACIALEKNDHDVACYALTNYFSQCSPLLSKPAWFLYTDLIIKTGMNIDNKVTNNSQLLADDWNILFETAVFIQYKQGNLVGAKEFIVEFQNSNNKEEAVKKLLFIASESPEPLSHTNQEGQISNYVIEREFGYIKDNKGRMVYFHRSAILDDELRDELTKKKDISGIKVQFEERASTKGLLAVSVTKLRTIRELYDLAKSYADLAEYEIAISQIKQVLAQKPGYEDAEQLLKIWKEFALITGVPKGSNPYARAKRIQLVEKNPARSIQLFRLAIQTNDNLESAIKDLYGVLLQMGKYDEGIKILQQEGQKIRDPKFVKGAFVSLYYKMGQYDSAIAILEDQINHAKLNSDVAKLSYSLGQNYMSKGDYEKATVCFRKSAEWQPYNIEIQRLIAFCLFNQQNYSEAKNILNKIIIEEPDNLPVLKLIDAVKQAETTGRISAIAIDMALASLSSEISEFAKFILSKCEFKGISPDRLSDDGQGNKTYTGSLSDKNYDIARLVDNFGRSHNPYERSNFYLSAARLEQDDNSEHFYTYLSRSLISRGDAAIVESRSLDSARIYYCEALAVYDFVREGKKGDERDALTAIVRFLYSTLGLQNVPSLQAPGPNLDDTLDNVIPGHPNKEKLFDLISYLLRHSRFASQKIIGQLYSKGTLHALTRDYLSKRGIVQSQQQRVTLEEFVGMWNKVQEYDRDNERKLRHQIIILKNVEFTTASLESSLGLLRSIGDQIAFDLDRDRIRIFVQILNTVLDLKNEHAFEEQERLIIQVINRCDELIDEIFDNPTKLCVRDLLPIVLSFKHKTELELSRIYESSLPQISLRMPVEATPLRNDNTIDIQIQIENRSGCSPAESLELVILSQDDELFAVDMKNEMVMKGSLRGGGDHIFIIKVNVHQKAINLRAFSIQAYIQFENRLRDRIVTPIENFSIRLYDESEFNEIKNPYAKYAEQSIVHDPKMFYGRDELIENSAKSIIDAGRQGKSIMIFGQKRAGKSSILYHLGKRLVKESNLLIVDLENIASIVDPNSKYPFTYQLLWSILRKLKQAIEKRSSSQTSVFNFTFPSITDFYNTPSSLILFQDVMQDFYEKSTQLNEWNDVQIVLLIDEFSYIFEEMIKGHIEDTFMKTWKALLQARYFSVVIAGPDAMSKFKLAYRNEFGTTEDKRVDYLPREEARKLIDEPIRIRNDDFEMGESRFREDAIDRIIDLTAGSPFYIQMLCNRLVDYMNENKAKYATKAYIEEVKKELIKSLKLDKFDNLINSGDTSPDAISDHDIELVLTSIAHNSKYGRCRVSEIRVDSFRPISDILKDLVHREVVEEIDGLYYRIRVDLFKEWLIAHPQN